MAEVVDIPKLDQAFKDFFAIGNWTMPTYSIFMVSCILSFHMIQGYVETHGHFSIAFALILSMIVFAFSFLHYRLMTLNLHRNAQILVGTFVLLGGVLFLFSYYAKILPI